MRQKTLLSRRIIAAVLVAALLVGSSFLLGGCSSMIEISQKIEEEERLEEIRQKEEAKREKINAKMEEIYLKSLSKENKVLKQEFDKFIEENFKNKNRIFTCLERQKVFNEDRYNEYLEEKVILEEELKKEEITEEEEKNRKEELWNKYVKSRNNIYDYLSEEEKMILDECEGKLNILYESN